MRKVVLGLLLVFGLSVALPRGGGVPPVGHPLSVLSDGGGDDPTGG